MFGIMSRTIALKGQLCRACAHEVLSSFIGMSIPRYARQPGVINRINGPKSFSTGTRLRTDENLQKLSGAFQNDAHMDNTTKPQSSPHTPWYLQEEDVPSSETQPITSRDQIPSLPEHPPPLLPIMTDYIFKDLGLDYLKFIDLRNLDPPPALGANVIMIIGTARSVKHLNVSADRLCRWLRSNWKMSPYADGLLGRNELKIKLRRRARRMRAASQAGALVDDKDDGITTGWICVNAGLTKDEFVEQQQRPVFEGFGPTVRGTRIVVQIFTEEKRAEVDLEKFWETSLKEAASKRREIYDENYESA